MINDASRQSWVLRSGLDTGRGGHGRVWQLAGVLAITDASRQSWVLRSGLHTGATLRVLDHRG
jgi:hypothetical protein